MEKPKTKLGKNINIQPSALNSFSVKRASTSGPSAAFKLTAIMGTNTQNPLLNRMDNYAYTSELPCTLPASGVRLICCRLENLVISLSLLPRNSDLAVTPG